MERPSIWVIIVVLLLGVLFLREPRFQRSEEIFLRWLIRHSQPAIKAVPMTIVDIGRENPPAPLEAALLLQGALEFKPTVIAVEPVLQWGERAKDQEQIFVDQAMRVPKLMLGAELTAAPDPDAPVAEIGSFANVSGRRGDRDSIGRRADAARVGSGRIERAGSFRGGDCCDPNKFLRASRKLDFRLHPRVSRRALERGIKKIFAHRFDHRRDRVFSGVL